MNWKFKKVDEEDNLLYVVYELDNKQQIIPYTGRRYWHEEEALAIAEALNMNGSNVIVFKELAYCNYVEEMI
jgi:hypothetical protein